MASLRTLRLATTGAALALLFIVTAGPASAGAPSGEQLFDLCTQCHGSAGQGNQDVGAPPIAGMAEWYVAKQIRKFKDEVRADDARDHEGLRMRPMVRFLKEEAWIDNVSAYVASLPMATPVVTLHGGDAERGKGLYAVCAACHGQAGEGVKATNGAPLVGLSDWYIYRSIEKFKSGARGSSPKDTDGAVMRGMAMILADDQAMKDVIAHIMSFPTP
jgi:cytochrome c oxidase subunit 2